MVQLLSFILTILVHHITDYVVCTENRKQLVIEKVIKENKVKSHLMVQLLSFILTS